ncbi:hypothetical protein MRB53_018844 [Persea americana]|uniref:Uncharacterized protein n=1 Tax=Persea americana TaxID=3435 RepID=A0ACC2M933_PERAE|nr:hypothetical protein MRB53_018844 [Persea americana]|eukprot:TRINITY_DN4969_c0_g1_i2.p1 TRINITY_DN4969_c0_g1~~TRINITY_DN4969_c0_g1_i2.p1  ORF type:complete len:304 (-),score=57.42 TRINITY_DN4969_c0_g1_i2:910-1821(-)
MGSLQTDLIEEVRDWAELQPDVLSLIFQKLGCIEVLLTAQGVCSSWNRFTYDPRIWRRIDMRNSASILDSEYDLEKMARAALDRSCGQCVEFSAEGFASNELLEYLMEKVSILKCLCLVSCYGISNDKLIGVAKKFPQLEELEITYCSFSKEVLETVGQSCPQLKHLRLNRHGYKYGIECDDEALAIAGNMPELRQLQLFGNNLSDHGLWAILDGCPHLESLDLRRCFNVNMAGKLQKRCMDQIRDLKFPNDSTDDYEFDAELGGYGSYDEDYSSGFSEIDLLSAEMYYELSDQEYDFSDYEC